MLSVADFNKQTKRSDNYNLTGKIKVKLLVVLTGAVTALFFVQLVFANNLATDGQRLSEIETEIQRLEAENTTLMVKIAQESSLINLSKKAKDLGFAKPENLILR